MALGSANRLKHRRDFSAVYQKGSRYRSRHLTLRTLRHQQQPKPVQQHPEATLAPAAPPFHPQVASSEGSSNATPTPSRVGISISQKVSKRAVIRNRIKRQLRAGFRSLLARIAPGWDLVVVVHPQAVECDYLQFLQELEQLLIDAEVLDDHSRRGLL